MPESDPLIVDGLVFYSDGYAEGLHAANVAAINLTVSDFEADLEVACDQIAWWHNQLGRPDTPWHLVETAADVQTARAQDKVGLIMGWQNMRPIADNLDRLYLFYQLGLRIMQLTYNRRNFMGDGCLEPNDSGLSALGESAVHIMNEIGIAIDLSHVGEHGSLRAAEISEKPVLVTHANAKAVSNSPRNKSDDVIRAVAATGGVIGASIYGPMCWDRDPAHPPSLDDFIRHLEHIVQVAGIEHVGMGTDLPAVSDLSKVAHILEMSLTRSPGVIADYVRAFGNDAKARYPRECSSHRDLPKITLALKERGWHEADIHAVLGENLVRALAEIWQT